MPGRRAASRSIQGPTPRRPALRRPAELLCPARVPGPPGGFDFTLHIRRLADDISRRLPELGHVRMDEVAIRFCQARKAVPYGIQASLTPLRFENGALTARRRGRMWTIQRIRDESGARCCTC